MKLVVVTGCLGFIGSYVTERLLKEGFKVLGVDKVTYAANKSLIGEYSRNKNFTFLKEDICELRYLPDCDYVINIAAESHVGNSIIDDTEFIKSNLTGVQNLLQLIKLKPKNIGISPILFHFSTDEVYGDVAKGNLDEDSLLNPSNPYAALKAAADILIKSWHRTFGIDYILIRPVNNYGNNQYPEKLVPLTVKALQRGKKIILHDNGSPVRTWLHAEDTADAVFKIINSGVKNEIFNISSEYEQKNIDTVKKIIDTYFEKDDINYDDFLDFSYNREGQDVRYGVDCEKIKKIGWSAEKKFDSEIIKIVKHYKGKFIW